MRQTVLSEDRRYRYTLWRDWSEGGQKPYVTWIMLNPSTADEMHDDPTIRRCMAFTKAWSFEVMCVVNLFAFRATDPVVMRTAIDPIGAEVNDGVIQRAAAGGALTIAAWGAGGNFMSRDRVVREQMGLKLHYLRLTALGHPGHPLYLPKTLTPQPWN